MSKIIIDRKVLERWLDAMQHTGPADAPITISLREMREALKTDSEDVSAKAQHQQEPVAWMHEWHDGEKIPLLHNDTSKLDLPKSVRPLVFGDTSPPARRPLTDDDMDALVFDCGLSATARDIARAIEAAHGIKETKC